MPALSPVSVLLRRNLSRLSENQYKRIILINPPADEFALEISANSTTLVSIYSNDYSIYQYYRKVCSDNRLTVEFNHQITFPDPVGSCLAIIYMPREKPYLEYLLANTLVNLTPGDQLWLPGENRSGIKSAGKRLQKISTTARKLDSARHCSLFALEIDDKIKSALCTTETTGKQYEVNYQQQSLKFITLPAVFSYGSLDPASKMLLATLQEQPVKGRVLDFACGCGVIGLSLSSAQPESTIDLLDVNAMALASTENNIDINCLSRRNLRVFAADIFSTVTDSYNAIISNPPFHRHSKQSLEVSKKLIAGAPKYLHKGGELRIVANKHLPYLRLFNEVFSQVDILQADKFFQVIRGRNSSSKNP